MPKYLVERHLPGLNAESLASAAGRARQTTAEMTREGIAIRYLHSTYVPDEEKCFCLFEGPSAQAVRAANERAGLPFVDVCEVVHVVAGDPA